MLVQPNTASFVQKICFVEKKIFKFDLVEQARNEKFCVADNHARHHCVHDCCFMSRQDQISEYAAKAPTFENALVWTMPHFLLASPASAIISFSVIDLVHGLSTQSAS